MKATLPFMSTGWKICISCDTRVGWCLMWTNSWLRERVYLSTLTLKRPNPKFVFCMKRPQWDTLLRKVEVSVCSYMHMLIHSYAYTYMYSYIHREDIWGRNECFGYSYYWYRTNHTVGVRMCQWSRTLWGNGGKKVSLSSKPMRVSSYFIVISWYKCHVTTHPSAIKTWRQSVR